MALQGYNASIKVQSAGVAMTDEATSTSDDQTYQITDSAKRILDLNTVIVVKDDGVITTENYEISYLDGTITFDTADVARGPITITGSYLTPATVGTAKSYSFSGTADIYDTTDFSSTGSRKFQAGLVSGTVSLGRFHVSDDVFIDDLLAGEIVIIELYVDATNYISCYGVYSSDNIESPVDGLITEDVSFQITTQIGVN